jgi:hypothetical protein
MRHRATGCLPPRPHTGSAGQVAQRVLRGMRMVYRWLVS